ncbi:MAG: beta-ketoacyl-[acyl-carrier-protein] synthase family protein [Desulfuromonas sp.]|nr:beta-ketoacyl-[acyl-carrier-protein] synthase family protein [Desulfuromonas sp.]
MRKVLITDSALVTGLGDDLTTTWRRLLAGDSAIRAVENFDTGNYVSSVAALINDLPVTDGQSRLYPLLERLLSQLSPLPPLTSMPTRLLTATTKGAIDLLEQQCRDQAEFSQLLTTLPGAMTQWLNQRLALNDRAQNINAACASSTLAIARGAAMIAHGQAEVVLVVCADLVSEFVFSGFSALQALSPGASRPFDAERCGLTLGEGAAAVVLMSEQAAEQHQRPCQAQLCGWGAANDANHITAPARDGCGLIQAVNQALTRAEIDADRVDAISAHGTGTVYNDMMELTAFESLFAGRNLSISSVKGAFGHTLGAAGGIETVLAIPTLNDRLVPPTCGFVTAEQFADGQVSSQPQPFSGDMLLSTNSGFGGVNAALLIKRGDNG